jgi:hypothetical protein
LILRSLEKEAVMLKVRIVAVLGAVIASALMSAKLNAWAADQVTLVKEHTPASTIVMGRNLPAAETYAGQELQKFLSKISGAQIPIKEEGEAVASCKILLGTFESNSSIKALRNQLKSVESLGDEGFLITTLDGNLVIAGGGTSGVLYGVYTFLEKYLGCRWYFPGMDDEIVPKRGTIQLGAISHSEQPSLSYRGLMVGDVPGNREYDQAIVDWMARNKMNRKTTSIDVIGIGIDPANPQITMTQYEGMRSRAIIPDMIDHSFWWLVPADEFYDKHPEYFPLINGKRVRPVEPGSISVELCLSNPDVLAICVEKTRAFFAKYPEVQTMGITQNDNITGLGWCNCEQCKAMGRTRTDQLMTFMNRVATEIHKTNPDKYVGFFAYSDCDTPPTVKPLDNVRMEYVRNWRCYKHALNDPRCEENSIRASQIQGWLKVVNPSHFT